MSKQIYFFFCTMHQVWNSNITQVRNIKLTYLPGLQKRTSMDGCNISSAPSSHLTKTLDEILWCSEPQNFLLKCICSISCKTNHKKHSIFKSTPLSATLTFTCLVPVLSLLKLSLSLNFIEIYLSITRTTWPQKRCVVLMGPTNLARYFTHLVLSQWFCLLVLIVTWFRS